MPETWEDGIISWPVRVASLVRSCAPAPIFPARAAQFIPLALGCLSDGQAVPIEEKEEEEQQQQQQQPP